MDLEREPGSDLGGESPDDTASQQPTDTSATDAERSADATAEHEPQHEDSAHTDWPAADHLVAEPAPTPAAAEPVDPGDDSDAPIELGDGEQAPAAMAEDVHGETVNIKQGGAQTVDATTVSINQGGAGRVNADTMTLDQSGVGIAHTNTLTLGSGSTAFAVFAKEATVEEGANALFLVARSFDGDVQPTIDWRSALAFGAGRGLVLSIIRRLR